MDRPAVLAELAALDAFSGEIVFAERGGGVAWIVEEQGKSRVLHGGRAGAWYEAVAEVVLSPDGRRCAYAARSGGAWRMVLDGKEGPSFAAVEAPVFSPDGQHLAYRARAGEGWRLVVDDAVSGGSAGRYLWYAFGAGSSRIAFVDQGDDRDRGRLVVSDLSLRHPVVVDPVVSEVTLSADGTRLAAVSAGGAKRQVLTLAVARPEVVTRGREYDAAGQLAFGRDGTALAYVAERAGAQVVALDDREAPLEPGDNVVELPVVRPGGRGVDAVVVSNGAVRLRHLLGEGAAGDAAYNGIEGLVYSDDGRSHAFAAEKDGRFFVVANGKDGPVFDRVVGPAFSPDGRWLVYRARKDGRRFVVVADRDGGGARQLPGYEQVFPVRFTADGQSIAYGVKSGRELAWKVEPLRRAD